MGFVLHREAGMDHSMPPNFLRGKMIHRPIVVEMIEDSVTAARHANHGERLIERFCAYVSQTAFPCVGAKSALFYAPA